MALAKAFPDTYVYDPQEPSSVRLCDSLTEELLKTRQGSLLKCQDFMILKNDTKINRK